MGLADSVPWLLAVAALLAAIFAVRASRAALQVEDELRETIKGATSIVASAVGASDSTRALDGVAEKLAELFQADACVLALPTGDGRLYCGASYGYEAPETLFIDEDQGVCGAVYTTGRPLVAPDVSEEPRFIDRIGGVRSVIAAPLRFDGRILGALEIESRDRRYEERDIAAVLPLADQLGAVLENIHLRGEAARRAEEEQERLRRADTLKDDFIATVSHELRTPLTSIKGYTQTLLHRGGAIDPSEQQDFLRVVVRQCDRLGTLVESLLLASRLEAGDVEGDPVYLMLPELLAEVVETADCVDRVQLDVDKGIGLVADPNRLHHILRNLIENACKYSPEAEPVLVRGRVEQEEVVVEVLDRGPGIPEDAKHRVFERFQRLSDGVGVPGTGLGLYIARRFARDLGGDITVSRGSEPSWTGAHFRMSVPVGLRERLSTELVQAE